LWQSRLNMHATLNQLHSLADVAKLKPTEDDSYTFEGIGLILCVPPRIGQYESTPKNSLSFARTGGDGVHFSFVLQGTEYTEDSPIVMTVPMAFGGPCNAIVGENLRDFLALGCVAGYFALEQLLYNDRHEFIRELEAGRADRDHGAKQRQLLLSIKRAFGLSPWKSVASRLAELEQRYASQLIVVEEG